MGSLPYDIWSTEDEPRLGAVLDNIWHLLQRGVADHQHGFHTPSLASVSRNWSCSLRTIVLRGAERDARRLTFHTDVRSQKIGELAEDSRIALMFYDAPENTQLRIDAVAHVHIGDALARACWDGLTLGQQCQYLVAGPPGLPFAWPTSGLPPELESREPDPDEAARGRFNFAVVTATITHIDWLYLTRYGHRRATFSWDDEGRLKTSWLVP